jgi:hypothetical protein
VGANIAESRCVESLTLGSVDNLPRRSRGRVFYDLTITLRWTGTCSSRQQHKLKRGNRTRDIFARYRRRRVNGFRSPPSHSRSTVAHACSPPRSASRVRWPGGISLRRRSPDWVSTKYAEFTRCHDYCGRGGCTVDTADSYAEGRGSEAGMKNKLPFPDPSPDPDQHPYEPRTSELLTPRPKATFQWPPDCLWPFIDRGWDSET